MVDAGSKLTYEEKIKVQAPMGPRSRPSTDESVLTISRSKTFLEELIHMTTQQTKEKTEAGKHTMMIQMLKTKNK